MVVLTYNSARWLDACFGSLRFGREPGAAPGERADFAVHAVDNGSTDGTPDLLADRFPEVRLTRLGRNTGFAAGNNVAIRAALEEGADFVYLLNADARGTPGFLAEALRVAGESPRAGAVQSLVLLDPETSLVNTAGNRLHYLGFGTCGDYRARADAWLDAGPREISYASGAGVLLRAAALREAGLFDEFLFLYHEDLDLGWRLRVCGWSSVLAPRSVVHHHHEFRRSPGKMYYMERNRLVVVATNYSAGSLALLAPALLATELAILAASLAGGWGLEKLRATRDFLRPSTLAHVLGSRRELRSRRRAGDREVAGSFVADMVFEGVTGPFVLRVANPVLRLLWRLLRPLLPR